MISESIPDLVRAAQELCCYNVAGFDLNMGYPFLDLYRPTIYREEKQQLRQRREKIILRIQQIQTRKPISNQDLLILSIACNLFIITAKVAI